MRNRSITQKLALALTAAALAVPAATPAVAQTEPRSIAVEYSDLNLASAKGQKVLSERLNRAARAVCGMDEQTTGSRLPPLGAVACYDETRTRMNADFAALISEERRGG